MPGLVLAALLAVVVPAAAQAGASPGDTRPNVVLLVVDDLRLGDMSSLTRLQDMLVAKGTSFRQFYTPNALCCPSRTSMLRGQFSHNHLVWTNFARLNGGFATAYRLGLETDTIGVWLQQAGYDTALLGKYLNGYGETGTGLPSLSYYPPGWTTWYALLDQVGAQVYQGYGYSLNENGTITTRGYADEDYSTDVLTRRAVAYIDRRSGQDRKPFFLYLAPTAPHKPLGPAPRHAANRFSAQTSTFASAPAFNEADVSDKPAWVQAVPPLSRPAIRKLEEENRARLGSMLAVEDMVQELIDALTRTGELENTFIFFVSDNGFHLGEHRLHSKATLYDESVRVPLVVRGPGVPAGLTLDHMAYNHDLPTTIAAIASATPAGFVDGVSLLPLFDNAARPPRTAWRRSVLLEHRAHSRSKNAQPDAVSIRTDNYQYVEYVDGAQRCELYDIRAGADPAQLRNRCGDASLAAVQEQLAARLRDLRSCATATCRQLEWQQVP